MSKRVSHYFEEENSSYRLIRFKRHWLVILKRIFFYFLFAGILFGNYVFAVFLSSGSIFSLSVTKSTFLNESLQSFIIISLTQLCSLFITKLSDALYSLEKASQIYHSKQIFAFVFELLAYSSYVFLRSSVIFTSSEFMNSFFPKRTTFLQDYDCP